MPLQLGLSWKDNIPFNSNWALNGGYQFLRTGDKDQIAEIKSGTVYTKNSQGYSRLMKLNEYVGLPNTSKHKLQSN